ncbi:SH3 domain-containing kinase-binding protein 1-like isoform X2 [Neodiprion virginianus]|uniref:SH3 domain-containing kinase-binding protein 1-like isoform X2 n=1 Tax=Neodiprion virginianus TaxID=2961670 RepID=UPI001EE6D932|nr:SH3 domain-containing kinase-binding protein 1-like isoform X2 [Neodiprion virginianus]
MLYKKIRLVGMEAIVEYNYEAQESDELTIRKGDVIKDIRVMPGGWWEGTLRDKRGMFPDNFVKVLESAAGVEMTSSVKNEEVVLRNGGSGQGRRWCKVQFSYEPCNEDELALTPQESLEFLGEVEEGWWRGRLRGRIGVFPSNFVSPPTYEEPEKDKYKRELCRVLYPYEALNEDELTLVEGEVLTILSKDAPDKGWWKGELRGRIGLFPDNFVEVLGPKGEQHEQHDQPLYTSGKSSIRHSVTTKRTEKAHARRSLDTHNIAQSETTRKSSVSTSSSSSSTSGMVAMSGDKKPNGSQLLMTSLKRLVGGGGNSNGNSSNGSSGTSNLPAGSVSIDDELDGVQRGEGLPLSHPTASRARLPRRRLPSSQHLRHQNTVNSSTTTTTTIHTESNLANGSAVTPLERLRDEDVDSESRTAKGRRIAPWVEELKLNQMERRKTSPVEKPDKPETKKPRSSDTKATVIGESNFKIEMEGDHQRKAEESGRGKDTERAMTMEGAEQPPPFVPYPMYCQLLERVAMLEEKQTMLQQTIDQLTEQLVPLLQSNVSTNNKL